MMAHLSWVVIVSGVTGLITIVFWFFMPKDQRLGFFIVILGVAALGTTVGLHGGLSRVGVVGQIMAAVLGLLGGLVLWLFALKRADGPVASIVVLALSMSIFLAYREGSRLRIVIESYDFWREQCTATYLEEDLLASPARFQLVDGLIGDICGEILKSEREILLGDEPPG